MGQTFEYPNLVAGTDAWSDWWEPAVGVSNATVWLYVVEFPRAIEADDVVCAGVEFEFDGLDLTADNSVLFVQGTAENSWHFSNVVAQAIINGFPRSLSHGNVLNGTHLISGVDAISARTYGTEWDKSPVGHTRFNIGLRVNYCGGGRLRVRRLMVTLNGDGVPRAWAPAAGEVWPE